jgi:hypothetical protein
LKDRIPVVVTRFVTSYNNDALYKAMADKQGTQMKQVKRNMNQIEKTEETSLTHLKGYQEG